MRSELGKSPSTLPLPHRVGRRACKAQPGHPPPSLPGTGLLLTCFSKPHRGLGAQASVAREAFSSTPSVLQEEKLRLQKGGSWIPVCQENASPL